MSIPTNLPPGFNLTLLDNTDLCTIQTCPLSLAHVDYVPSLAGNAFYDAIFGLMLVAQIVLAIKYRTWGYGVAMFGGLVLEIIGYVARIQMSNNPFLKNPFLMYLVCLTIGPAFLSAAVYLCLSRIVVTYSDTVSRFRPATYTLVFITCDFVALMLQAIGGGIAASANTVSQDNLGKNVMVAGVSWQVASLTLFSALCADFALRLRKASSAEMNPAFTSLRESMKFKLFLWSLGAATLTIFIRSVFRCAELSGGFHGPLANQQVTFMILEGAMVCIACICLTVFHPGLIFRQAWHIASWSIRKKPAVKHVDNEFVDAQSGSKQQLEELRPLPDSTTNANCSQPGQIV